MGELADKKMLLQSKGVRLGWELEDLLSRKYAGAMSDYLSFFLDKVPVGILNGFYTDHSPFEIRENHDGYAIFRMGEVFHEMTFIKRPGFFDETTSKGRRMERLCKMVAPGFPIIYMNRGCMYWGARQCRFCVVGYIDTDEKKDPHEVAEVVAAGVDEGVITSHVALTSGALPKDKGLKLLGEASDAIKEAVDIPVSVNAEPPRDLKHISWISNADSVYFNIEVFDVTKRKAIMPGKSEFSINYYDDVFDECFEYFDENQVASVLLAGLEDYNSYEKGLVHLASRGVLPVPVPFYPAFHSKLEGVSPPGFKDMKRIYERAGGIIEDYGLDPFRTRAGFIKGGAIFALKEVMKGV